MDPLRIAILTGSTHSSRQSPVVARWVLDLARQYNHSVTGALKNAIAFICQE